RRAALRALLPAHALSPSQARAARLVGRVGCRRRRRGHDAAHPRARPGLPPLRDGGRGLRRHRHAQRADRVRGHLRGDRSLRERGDRDAARDDVRAQVGRRLRHHRDARVGALTVGVRGAGPRPARRRPRGRACHLRARRARARRERPHRLPGRGARRDRGATGAAGRPRGGAPGARARDRDLRLRPVGRAGGAASRPGGPVLPRGDDQRLRGAPARAAARLGAGRGGAMSERLAIDGGRPAVSSAYRERWRSVRLRSAVSIAAHAWRDVNTVAAGEGPVADFEQAFARLCERRHALVMNSGTAALHSAYFAAGVGPGTEVIVPSYTFFASAAPILQCGGTPVFCDVDERTLTADPDDVARRITARTRAICVVHLWGNPAPMDRFAALARRHGLALIEDCSHAHGATYQGRPVGSWGDVGCFSLQGQKAVSGGEAGIAVRYDPAHAGGWTAKRFIKAAKAEGVPISEERYARIGDAKRPLHRSPIFAALDVSSLGGNLAATRDGREPPHLPVTEGLAGRLLKLPPFTKVPERYV